MGRHAQLSVIGRISGLPKSGAIERHVDCTACEAIVVAFTIFADRVARANCIDAKMLRLRRIAASAAPTAAKFAMPKDASFRFWP